MRLLSPKVLSAGLGLTLLAAPLAMAQSDHHMSPAHVTVHRVVTVHHSRVAPHAHVVVRRVSVRHEVVPVHHADLHHG
ncbi:MAG TPA: hypothetical protein VL356_10980 [Acidocella sp.]|jgi:hypothetical protein|nr:hypothetical protein [Acidocella sp.]